MPCIESINCKQHSTAIRLLVGTRTSGCILTRSGGIPCAFSTFSLVQLNPVNVFSHVPPAAVVAFDRIVYTKVTTLAHIAANFDASRTFKRNLCTKWQQVRFLKAHQEVSTLNR